MIEQSIDVVEALWCRSMITMVHVDVFSEVGLDAFDAHLEQGFEEGVLVPIGGFIVSEVNGARIVEGGEI